jgi:four helix bundle protein
MTPQELRNRIKQFAYRCVAVAEALPPNKLSSKIIANQLIRSSFSSTSNYRAAARSQSKAQFLSKLRIALEELDESLDWLETIRDLGLVPQERLSIIPDEAEQLVKILNAAKHTLQQKLNKKDDP